MRRGISLVCVSLILVCAASAAALARPRAGKAYGDMSAAEKLSFLEREANRAVAAISDDGKAPALSADGLLLIKREVDDYASRVGSTDGRPWHENMRAVLDRQSRYAPGIAKTFQTEGVPAALGISLALVESEFNECLESPMGAKGVFQMLPATAERFGLAAEDLCDSEKSAVAAARYLKATRNQFGSSGRGSLLAVLAYNQGEGAVNKAFGSGQDFWGTLLKTPNAEGSRYVARILAAMIVGENAQVFGM